MSTQPMAPKVSGTPILPVQGPNAGGERRLVKEELLVKNRLTGSNAYFANRVARARTTIPSVRLHHKVTLSYRPYQAEEEIPPQSGNGSWPISIREFARDSYGRWIGGATVIQNLMLPNSWEAATLSREWRIALDVPTEYDVESAGTGMEFAGEVWIVAEWEPVAAAPMSDEELARLFSLCNLQVDNAVNSVSSVTE